MSEAINKQDIIQGTPFADIAKEIDLAVKQLNEFDVSLKKVSSDLSEIAKNSTATVAGINAINQAEKQSKKVVDEKLANDKLLQKIKREQQSAEQALQRQRERGMAQMAREAKLTAEAERPYNKMSATLNKLRNEYKDLAVSGQENTKRARELKVEIQKLDTTLKGVDASAGQFQRNVGNYPNTFKSAIGALSQLGIAFSGITIAKSAFETIKNFDEANADMAKTLGISTKEASKLSMGFTKLGSTTTIQGLQEIATIGGQFGISAQQIGGFVESMDKINVALGSDFGGVEETAKQLGALRNIFTDIKTENIDQDLLGIGNALNELSSKGAKVEIVSDFANRISGLATPLGVTAGEILGLSATLANLNVNAERGGTAVGTIFQRMTQDADGFAKVAGVSTEEFTKLLNEDMVGAFKLVAKSFKGMDGDNVLMSKTLESLKLTGSGASEVFLKMASNTELLDENVKLSTESLKEQDSILQEVDKKSSTVSASVARLGNAWDNFILGVNDGTGAQNGIITFFDFVSKNLPTIITTVAKLTAGFLAFRTAQALVNTDFKALLANFTKLKTDATDATGKMSGFGNALKGIGWSVAIGFAIDLGMKLYDIASGAQSARDALAKFNKQVELGSKQSASNVASIQEAEKQLIAKLNEQLKDKKINQSQYNELVKQAKKNSEDELKSNIKSSNQRKQAYKDQLAELQALEKLSKSSDYKTRTNAYIELQSKAAEFAKELNITGDKAYGFLETNAEAVQVMAQLKANIGGTNERLKTYHGALKEINDSKKDFTDKTTTASGATDEDTKSTDNNTKSKKKNTNETKEQSKALQDLADIENEQAEKRKTKDDERIARQIELGELIQEARIKDAEFDLTEQEKEIKAVQEKYGRMMDLTEEFGYGQAEMNEAMREEINAINAKYAQEEIAIQEAKNEELKKEDEKKIEQQKELANEINKIQDGISEALKAEIDRRIELSKKEEESAKSRQSFFESLAENGNITAQQSIAEQIEIQREAQQEQERLERRKQQIEMISAGLSTFNSAIAGGKTPASALAETILSTSTLVGILKNLNFFEKGTDHAPKGLAVVDEKGAEIITDKHGNIKEIGQGKGARFTMLDQGDKVITATKTAQILDQIKQPKAKFDNGGNTSDLMKINETLKRIEMQNKNNGSTVDWGGISAGVATVIERKQVGRSRTTNVFKS